MTGGGVQTPGFAGHGKSTSLPKFPQAAALAVVQFPKELKDQIRDKPNETGRICTHRQLCRHGRWQDQLRKKRCRNSTKMVNGVTQ